MVRLTQATPFLWSIGVAGASARHLRVDSASVLTQADSQFYSAGAARAASAVPALQGSSLTGLPFAVTAMRLLRVGDTTTLVAQLVRRVNQEANPAEERTLIIAERVASGPLTRSHAFRSEGTEETVSHFDLLGAFRLGALTYLVISTEGASGSLVEILERTGTGWRSRWTRTIAC
jgi:hypothetical protein